MIHVMYLNEEPFELMKKGLKKVELRLYDEKRRKVGIDDIIIFLKRPENKEFLVTRVKGLAIFKSFKDLFEYLNPKLLGLGNMPVEDLVKRMKRYYTEEEEKKYGVVGIYLEVLNEWSEDVDEVLKEVISS